MRTNRPTQVKEDYLRAIYLLQEKDQALKLIDIASYLRLSRSTVTERIQELAKQGYLTYSKYGELKFSRRGYMVAKKLTHKHRIIEVFLHDVLHIPKNEIHQEAHLLEHAMSDKVIKKLAQLLGNPTTDSHGSPIPKI